MFVRVEFRGTGVGKALGFLSPGYTLWGTHIAPYSPVSQPVSGLGLGPTAPFMNAAFVLSGILLLLGVAGIFQGISEMNPRARWICAGLLALSPVGAIVCGIFTLEFRVAPSCPRWERAQRSQWHPDVFHQREAS